MKIKTINITERQNNILKNIRVQREMTFSLLIRLIVDEYIDKYGHDKEMEGQKDNENKRN